MSKVRITETNAREYHERKVRFFYGPMHGEQTGVVVGHTTDPRWGTNLMIQIDGTNSTTNVNQFTDVGIGCYLLPEAEPVIERGPVNPNSPWYVKED